MRLRDLSMGTSVHVVVFVSRARECSFGNLSKTSQTGVSLVIGASATIDVDCTLRGYGTATLTRHIPRVFSFLGATNRLEG